MNDLSQRLAHEADQFSRRGGTQLELSQVLERAGEIRRGRRMRATLLMAACVLAIAVPTVLVAADRGGTHEPSPAPATKVDNSPLTLEGLKAGHEPKTGWLQGDVWHAPDGHESQFSGGRIAAVARVGGALLVSAPAPHGQRADLVPPVDGRTHSVPTWPMDGGFAVSPDGKVGAFVKPDGTPVLVKDDGTHDELPRVPRGIGFDAVGVGGPDCTKHSGYAGCQVWLASRGEKRESWLSTAAGDVSPVPAPLQIVLAVTDSRIAGVTRIKDNTACSAVSSLADPGRPAWTTCDDSLLSFAPDGAHLLATTAYRDGNGDVRLAVLDSTDGKAVLDLSTADGALIHHMEWEDDSHVLATVYAQGRWAVVRVGLDGSREYAVPPVAGNDTDSPFVLPTR